MIKSTFFKPVFIISLILGLVGIGLKLLHLPAGKAFIVISAILTLVYIIIALYEILRSQRITVTEKIMWTIGFIILSTLTGLLYFFLGRPRILRDYKVLNQQGI